jgi:quinol monooxygenase YgiN
MSFIQTIEYQTTRIDEIRDVIAKYRASSTDNNDRRATVTLDRDRPNTYVTIVEFDSWEAAQANSSRPETTAMAKEMMALCDGPPIFRNLDVVDGT